MTQLDWTYSNIHVAYPFYPPVSATVKALVADALIVDPTNVNEQIKLNGFTINAEDDITWDLLYATSSDDFFDSAPTTQIVDFGEWYILESALDGKTIRLLVSTEAIGTLVGYSITGMSATFIARVHQNSAGYITSIEFRDELNPLSTAVFTEPVIIKAGYNVTLVENNNEIELTVEPGTGEGKYPSECTEGSNLLSINGVAPDDSGNFYLGTGDCYNALQQLTRINDTFFTCTAYSLEMLNFCIACCSCEDYSNVYQALQNLYDRAKRAQEELEAVKEKYDEKRGEMEERMPQDPFGIVQVIPKPSLYTSVLILLYNPTGEDIDPIPVPTITFSQIPKKVLVKSAYWFSSQVGMPWKFKENMAAQAGIAVSFWVPSGAIPDTDPEETYVLRAGGFMGWAVDVQFSSVLDGVAMTASVAATGFANFETEDDFTPFLEPA